MARSGHWQTSNKRQRSSKHPLILGNWSKLAEAARVECGNLQFQERAEQFLIKSPREGLEWVTEPPDKQGGSYNQDGWSVQSGSLRHTNSQGVMGKKILSSINH